MKRDVALVKSSALEARPAVSLFNLVLWKENDERYLKGIDRPFELRGESRLILSVTTNWMLGKFFFSFQRAFIIRSAKNLGMPLNNF